MSSIGPPADRSPYLGIEPGRTRERSEVPPVHSLEVFGQWPPAPPCQKAYGSLGSNNQRSQAVEKRMAKRTQRDQGTASSGRAGSIGASLPNALHDGPEEK